MATDIAIASLPTLPAGSVQGDDLLPIVDVHDLSNPGGTTKAVAVSSLTGSLLGLMSRVFNVRDAPYGAVGNGTHDDTAAIQAAINAASANPNLSGGCVYFPPGVYKYTTALTTPQLVSLLGDAPEVTELTPVGCDGIHVSVSAGVGPVFIQGISLYGTGVADGYTGISLPGDSVATDKTTGVQINGCRITNFYTGVSARTWWYGAINDTTIYNCWNGVILQGLCVGIEFTNLNCVLTSGITGGSGNSTGLLVDRFNYATGGLQQPQAIHVRGGQFTGFQYGCVFNYCVHATFDGVAFDQITNAGFEFLFGTGVTVLRGCYFGIVGTVSGTYGILMQAVGAVGAGTFSVRDCSFFCTNAVNFSYGIQGASLQSYVTIDGNYFSGFTGEDISLNGNGAGCRVTNNRCASSAPTNSIFLNTTSTNLLCINNTAANAILNSGSVPALTFSNLSLANGAAAQTATLTNGPTAGNPTKWIPINDNGTTRYIPAW